MASPSISERIKAARSTEPEWRDVPVVLDQDVAEQIAGLAEQIEQRDGQIADTEDEKTRAAGELRFQQPLSPEYDERIALLRGEIEELDRQRDVLRAGSLVRLRFEKMRGDQWSAIAARHPARVDAAIDRVSGYDYQATAREAAPLCGYALGENDAREDLSVEDWAGLFEVISGFESEQIASRLWEMNDWGPRKRVTDAGKAFAGGSATTSS